MRLQGTIARTGHRPSATAVVEQRVDRLLEHPLLVVDDDLGRAEVEQPLQTIVAVDHPAVEIVQVRGGEPATVELDHRAQLGRDHRDRLEDHHLGLVARVDERRDDLQPLDRAGLLLALGGLHLLLEVRRLVIEVDLSEQVAHRLGAHPTAEVLAEPVGRAEPVLELTERGLVVDDVLRSHRLEQLPHLAQTLGGVLDVGLGVVDVGLEGLAQLLADLVALLVGGLGDVQLQRLHPQMVLVGEVAPVLPLSRYCSRRSCDSFSSRIRSSFSAA